MTGHLPTDDDSELEAQLRRRAVRGDLGDADRDWLVQGIIRSTTTAQRRSWLGWLAPVAAAAVLVLVAVIAIPVVLPRFAATSPAPTAAPAPVVPTVMSLEALRRLLVDVPAVGNKVVLAQGRVKRAFVDFAKRPCPPDLCTLGTIDDAYGRAVTVMGNADVQARIDPMNSDPVSGAVALKFSGSDTVELLGFVSADGPDGLVWPATETEVKPAESGIVSTVIVVRGWLTDTNGSATQSCPPELAGIPFCGPVDLVTDRPYWPANPNSQVPDPDQPDWIVVQPGAYHEYAPDPVAQPASSNDARLGTYLLRLVEAQLPAQTSRGWQVAGRLDDSAQPPELTPEPTPIDVTTLLSLQDLQQLLVDVPAVGSRTVLAQGRLSQNLPDPMKTCPRCTLGTMNDANGRPVTVIGSEDVLAALATMSSNPINAPMALRLASDGTVELLGLLRTPDEQTVAWPASATGLQGAGNAAPGTAIVVRGWLVDSDREANFCRIEIPPAGSPPPTDSPWSDVCDRSSWITADPYQPVQSDGHVTTPSDGIHVQHTAYQQFALDPAPDPSGIGNAPRLARYVLRAMVDPRPESSGARGWQVVGRVDDAQPTTDATVPPTTPAPEPTPTPESTAPATDLTLLTFAELRQRLVALPTAEHQWIMLGKAIIDRSAIRPEGGNPCTASELCPVGTITDANGGMVDVVADEAVRTAIGAASQDPMDSYVALRAVDNATVELLGMLDPDGPNGLVWPASAKVVATASGRDAVGGVVAVEGWLNGDGKFAISCTPQTSSLWGGCERAWLAPASFDPVQFDPVQGLRPYLAPADGIEVQADAYDNFAPNPVFTDSHSTARHAVYLLRYTTDSTGANGWIAVATLTGDLGDTTVAPSAPPTPEPTPASTPTPLAGVLSRDETKMAIDATYTTASGGTPRDIVGDVTIDLSRRPDPMSRQCHDPDGPCTVIGSISGFAGNVGTVVQRDVQSRAPGSPIDGVGPLAFRIASMGQVEYLGQVVPGEAALAWPVSDAIAKAASLPVDDLVAVHGWLVSGHGTCGPAPDPASSPAPVLPFACATHNYITPALEQITFPCGSNCTETRAPADGMAVQHGAAAFFTAPQPAPSGADTGHEGTYLVQVAVNRSTYGGLGTRGWLVIGRVDDTPSTPATPRPSPAPQPTVRSADELESILAADRPSMVGQTVIVFGTILNGGASMLNCASPCRIGTLDSFPAEPLVASSFDAIEAFKVESGYGDKELMALMVLETGLEYVGPAGSFSDGRITLFPVTGMDHPGRIAVAGGWLVSSGPLPCPAPATPTPPPDTPFEGCPSGWISPTDSPAWITGADGSSEMNVPDGSIRVQWEAYDAFAPDPQYADTPGNGGSIPRYGSYVLRLVADPRPGADPATGWQVVGRMDP